MYIDACHLAGIAVATDMVAFLKHKATFALFGGLVGKDTAVETCTDYEEIVFQVKKNYGL